jgi:hypothetical protein
MWSEYEDRWWPKPLEQRELAGAALAGD